MTATILVYMFFLHFLADFVLQSREMGKKKSENVRMLGLHLLIQFCVMFMGLGIVTHVTTAMLIASSNAVVHGVIDWNIWRLYKVSAHYRIIKDFPSSGAKSLEDYYNKRVADWTYWEDHLFYTTIGADQLAHIATLTLLAGYFL